jgi:hypothetical protein
VSQFYRLVPKDRRHNIHWRRELLDAASTDESVRNDLWEMCRDDLLFYVNTFLWTYDPRLVQHPAVPFITYGFQDDVLRQMEAALGTDDVLIKKSRDMGASWMLVTLFEWRWHFYPNQSFLLASRNEALVDKSGDPKSLLWKIDFLHKHLPTWLVPKTSRIKLHIENLDNSSTIDGETTTKDIARGDRRSAIGLDEFAFDDNGYAVDAATQHATNSRFFNSTSNGTGTAFYALEQKLPADQKIYLHWTLHPDKRRGAYKSENERLLVLDEGYSYPEEYPHILDGKTRSPWYDRECRRASHRQQIAREIDMDDMGSHSPVFDTAVLERMRPGLRPPFVRGEFLVDAESLEGTFLQHESGELKVWESLNMHGELPRIEKYVIGADISAGTGGEHTNNSVLQVISISRGAVVGSYASNTIGPEAFAALAISLCKWCNGAYLNWDATGPLGSTFTNEIIRRGYRNVYHRDVEDIQHRRKTQKLGYWFKKGSAAALMYELQRAFDNSELVLYDLDTLNECGHWRFKGDDVVYAPSIETPDESAKGRLHGDRVMALGVAWMAVQDRPKKTKPSEETDWKNMQPWELPAGTMARRMALVKQEKDTLEESEFSW